MGFRLGLSITPKAIGWCVFDLDNAGDVHAIRALGTRVFTPNDLAGRDPASGQSLAAQRREHRHQRRRLKRLKQRKQHLMRLLINNKLMPEDEAARKQLELRDPYELRARAISEPLLPFETGRALFHLGRRRGFKPARLDHTDYQSGIRHQAALRLETAMENAGAETVGAFLAKQHRHNQANRQGKTIPVRFRPQGKDGSPLWMNRRDMVADELVAIWAEQQKHYPAIFTAELLAEVQTILLSQRPAKPSQVPPCRLYPDDRQAPRSLPVVEAFEILCQLAALELDRGTEGIRRLRCDERDRLRALIESRKSIVKYPAMRKLLGYPAHYRFTAERKGLRGIEPPRLTNAMAKAIGPRWHSITLSAQTALATVLNTAEDDQRVHESLQENFPWIGPESRTELAGAPLPGGHSVFGLKAISELLSPMESQTTECTDPATGQVYASPVTCAEAIALIGPAPDQTITGDHLPHYAVLDSLKGSLIGNRVRNPSLHVALGQLRHVVNAIIRTYGVPDGIVVELDRELKLSRKALLIDLARIKRSERLEAAHAAWLAEQAIPDTWEHRLMLRLYDELPDDRKLCVYTGEPISLATLFDGQVVIDHILPMSLTLDDSLANKTLCYRSAAEQKQERLAAEAFGQDETVWQDILDRAARLLPDKLWRFQPDALARLGKSGPPLMRHLSDRQHISRLVRSYLETVCPYPSTQVATGRLKRWLSHGWGLTALEGYATWGLRHHAADAAITGSLSATVLQRLAAQFKGSAPPASLHAPFRDFVQELDHKLSTVIVSHRPDRRAQGSLHREAVFGSVADDIDGKAYNLVIRKPVDELTNREKMRIRAPVLRAQLTGRSGVIDPAIRHIRVLDHGAPVIIRHGPDGCFEKAVLPHGNHCVLVFEQPDGRWIGKAINLFEAVQGTPACINPEAEADAAEPVLRLYKTDMLQLTEEDGVTGFWVIRKLDPKNNRIALVRHDRVGPFPSTAYRQISYNGLKALQAKTITLPVLGK